MYLQGGSGFSLQGGGSGGTNLLQPASSGRSLQPAASVHVLQPAAGANVLQPATGNGGGGSYTPPAQSAPVYTPPPPPPPKYYDYQGNSYSSVGARDAANAKLEADYNNEKNSTFGGITDLIGDQSTKFGSGIQDYLDTRKGQVRQVNADAVQNELARESGMQGILDMVGNGLKSSGVMLGNNNAGSSSAAEAIARAYGLLGRQQATGVGNQFAQGNNKIGTEWDNILAADATEKRHIGEDKAATITGIVNSARSQIAALNQYAATASLPDRVDIESKAESIRQQALDALAKYDSTLSTGTAAQPRQSADDMRAAAHKLLVAGTAPEDAFQYTTDMPAAFQGTGPFASSLPIFITAANRNNSKRQ